MGKKKKWSALQEMQVQFLGWEVPLEKKMTTHCSILAWEIPWTRSLVVYSPWGRKESDMTEQLSMHTAQLHLHHQLIFSPASSALKAWKERRFSPALPKCPFAIMWHAWILHCFRHDDLVRFSYSTYIGHITLQVHEFTQVHGARNRMFKTKMM